MTAEDIVAILALVTIGAVLIFAIVSKERVERRKRDGAMPKSTLAEDQSSKAPPVDV